MRKIFFCTWAEGTPEVSKYRSRNGEFSVAEVSPSQLIFFVADVVNSIAVKHNYIYAVSDYLGISIIRHPYGQ